MSEERPAEAPAARPSEETFDRIAVSYRKVLDESLSSTGESSEFFARGRIEWSARRMRALGLHPRRILDFGCGTGSSAPVLREVFAPDSLLGVDVSGASIGLARQTHGAEHTRFLRIADYDPAPEMDLVYSNGVFHHIPPAERAGAMQLVFDSLRPGGLFAFWENNPWNPGTRWVMAHCEFDEDAIPLTSREATSRLRSAGFEVLRRDFLFIFPKTLGFLRPLEQFFTALPIGGQYQVLARKP